MDISAIGDLFSNMLFPAAMCILLFYFVFSEMKEMRKTIEANTLVIQKLADSLDDIRKE